MKKDLKQVLNLANIQQVFEFQNKLKALHHQKREKYLIEETLKLKKYANILVMAFVVFKQENIQF